MGLGESLLPSSLIYFNPVKVLFPHFTDEETDAQRFVSQAPEYPEALVEMQIFGPTPDLLRISLGKPENLHF